VSVGKSLFISGPLIKSLISTASINENSNSAGLAVTYVLARAGGRERKRKGKKSSWNVLASGAA